MLPPHRRGRCFQRDRVMPGFAPKERPAAGMGSVPCSLCLFGVFQSRCRTESSTAGPSLDQPHYRSVRAPETSLHRGKRGEEQSPGKGGGIGVMLTLPICSVPSAGAWALLPVLPAQGCSGGEGGSGWAGVGGGWRGAPSSGQTRSCGRGDSQTRHWSLSFLCPIRTGSRQLKYPAVSELRLLGYSR